MTAEAIQREEAIDLEFVDSIMAEAINEKPTVIDVLSYRLNPALFSNTLYDGTGKYIGKQDTSLINTNYFREVALHWEHYKVYTKAPKGSPEYYDFWKRETKRCLHGYSVGDMFITGRNYFYLNYCPIKFMNKEDERKKRGDKKSHLPLFYELDYNWWTFKDIAWNLGKHLCCLKTRRAGFSFKEAADGVYNYNFIPESVSWYFATDTTYLWGDGIYAKAKDMLDHLNEFTIWKKNRQVKDSFTDGEMKSSYYNEKGIEKGFKSWLYALLLKEPERARGKSGRKLTFEEAGKFKNLLKAWEICMPQVKEGDVINGQMTAFGTGGSQSEDIVGLTELFYTPDAYDVLPFYNIWEQGLEETRCGFFVPATEIYKGAIYDSGLPNRELALKKLTDERNKKTKESALLSIMEKPLTPQEALMQPFNNIFPVAAINEWINKLSRVPIHTSSLLYGRLQEIKQDKLTYVEFKPTTDTPFNDYPIKNGTITDSCVVIDMPPFKDSSGNIPENLYIVVADPYYKDVSPESPSIGACFVYERNGLDMRRGDKIVAWYHARPNKKETFIENLFLLAKYYNAKVQFDLFGGGQAIIDYANTNKLLQLLYTSDSMINSKQVRNMEKNKSYGISLTREKKDVYITYLSDWLSLPRGITEEGEVLLNLHTIKDIGLLREMKYYNRKKEMEGSMNYDRLVAAMLIKPMDYALNETEIEVTLSQSTENFWARDFYNEKTY